MARRPPHRYTVRHEVLADAAPMPRRCGGRVRRQGAAAGRTGNAFRKRCWLDVIGAGRASAAFRPPVFEATNRRRLLLRRVLRMMSRPDYHRRAFLEVAAGSGLLCGTSRWGRASGEPSAGMQQIDRFRDKLLECLGGGWPEPPPLRTRILQTESKDGYRLESLTYDAEPGDAIPALLLVPDSATQRRPAPAIAVWHQHAGQYHLGKSEPAGLAGNPMHHTGLALVREGYVVLCPDALCFEQRQDTRLKGGDYERFEFLRYVVAGKCMAWKNILDMRRAIDFLCSRPEVRKDRIGCYGHSMGSTHAWLVGPWESRLQAVVGNCCLPTYEAIHRHHMLHCFPNFIPGIHQYGDHGDIAACIAPRALHLNFGEDDSGSPIKEVRHAVNRIERVYAAYGASDRFGIFVEPGVGHVLSDAMWARTRDWFARHLT